MILMNVIGKGKMPTRQPKRRRNNKLQQRRWRDKISRKIEKLSDRCQSMVNICSFRQIMLCIDQFASIISNYFYY